MFPVIIGAGLIDKKATLMVLIRKNVFKIAVPIMLEQLLVLSLGTINTMMAGHIGKEAVSAIGMVDSINNIFISFFSALAVGGTVVVAQFIGQKNIRQANETMKQVLYSGLLVSILITILIWLFHKPILGLLFGSADRLVIKDAYTYLSITLLTYPLISLDLICNGIIRGTGNTKTPMKVTVFMNLINVVTSYFLIYGFNIDVLNIHLSGLGIRGAALGIAIARSIGGIIVIAVLIRGTRQLKLSSFRLFKFDKELLLPVFSIGIPASIESLLFNGGKLITQIFIVDMGTVSIATNAITGSVANILNIPGNSLCTTATVVVGQYMGRGKRKEAENHLSYITKASTILLLVLGAISFPIARTVISFYTTNTDIINLSTNLLRFNSFFIILWSISFVLPSGLKGAGDAKYTMITSIIGMWIFRITMGYILGVLLRMGIFGVWLGMYIDWMVRGSLYLYRFRVGKWLNHNVIKEAADAT